VIPCSALVPDSAGPYVCAGVLLCLAGLFAVTGPRYWRGDPRAKRPGLGPMATLLGDRAWWACQRGSVAWVPCVIVCLGAATLAFFLPNQSGTHTALLLFSAAAMLVAYLLATSIALFNRPKLLVPPPYRGELGLLAQRREERERPERIKARARERHQRRHG